MEVKIYIPHPVLQEYVINISTVDVLLPFGIKEVVTPYPPTPFQSLIFYCNHPVSMSNEVKPAFEKQAEAMLIGPQSTRVNIKVHERLSAIRVDFFPGALYRFLGLPMHEILNTGIDAEDAFGKEMKLLKRQLQDVTDLQAGKILVENFLTHKVKQTKSVLPFDESMKLFLHSAGNMRIEESASLACLSLKQFERKCKERLGMNPKAYSRILRFSKAYRMHESHPQLSWTEIAHDSGYFDQMHLIRDFKVFAGVNPGMIAAELSHTPLRMQKDLPN